MVRITQKYHGKIEILFLISSYTITVRKLTGFIEDKFKEVQHFKTLTPV